MQGHLEFVADSIMLRLSADKSLLPSEEIGLASGLIPTMLVGAECAVLGASERLSAILRGRLSTMKDLIWCSEPGGLTGRFGSCLGAIHVAQRLGAYRQVTELEADICEIGLAFNECENVDYLNGVSGVIAGLRSVLPFVPTDRCYTVVSRLRERLIQLLCRFPDALPSSWHEPSGRSRLELGFGHGLAGVVYTLRSCDFDQRSSAESELLYWFERCLLSVLKSENLVRLSAPPAFADAGSRLIGARLESVCDGLPGLLVSLSAFDVLEEPTVSQFCSSVLQLKEPRLGMLHGLAGLIKVLRLLGDQTAGRALAYASDVLDKARDASSSRPYDLFRGGLGILHSLLLREHNIHSPLLGFCR